MGSNVCTDSGLDSCLLDATTTVKDSSHNFGGRENLGLKGVEYKSEAQLGWEYLGFHQEEVDQVAVKGKSWCLCLYCCSHIIHK